MKLKIVFLLLLCTLMIYPQVGIGTQNPDNSSILELESTTKGFLPPRMTEVQMLAIPNPATGLIVYCTDCKNCGSTAVGELKIFNAISWNCISENYGLGSSVFTADCNSAVLSSSIYAGETSSSVITLNVTVTKLGTYYIESNIVNGLYFKGSGEFTTLGQQTVTLQSFGTAIQSGIFTWNYKAGSTSCSITETVANSKSGRIVKILTIGDYNFSTTYMNNLFNNNPNEFGPSGVVKCNSFEFTRIPNASRNTINVTNLVSTFSQYDIIIMTSSLGLATNVWDNSTEDALVNYMKTKKSVVILEGDDLNISSDFYTILQKIGITSTNTFGGVSYTEVVFDSSSLSPIKGTFGNISNKGVNYIYGQAWTFNTARTDVVLGRVRGAISSPSTVAFWDPTHNLYYNGDDDALYYLNHTACNIASPKSSTTCVQGGTEMRGARWLANLAAYAIETTPQKASIYE